MDGKLKELREARGLSMQQLADRAGVNKSTIYEAENHRHNPRIQTLRKLARALEVELADLITA